MAKSGKATPVAKPPSGNGHVKRGSTKALSVSVSPTLKEGLKNRTEQISRSLFDTGGANLFEALLSRAILVLEAQERPAVQAAT